ncbi:GNAT family N-acetyltransferase [Pendulispora albinea]|uniref:GNAT family N-acetyltransferase n=1 Tax=Pendulispora albinea TaxID=2741071 RepID=A0ABZ2M6R5_9BACT
MNKDRATAERMISLHLAVQNAATFWSALAAARGHETIRRPGFLSVDGRHHGMRILVLSPTPHPDEVAELTELARHRHPGKVLVEDAFNVVDMRGLGLTARKLPVMIRHPAPAPTTSTMVITKVEQPEQLEIAERIVVQGFPVPDFQPYQPGQLFPRALMETPGISLFLVSRDGATAGACVTVVDGTVGGLYWVTTLPEHRSYGVGRALMHSVLNFLNDRPVTLTAAKPGKPLYDSLGFETITEAAWWG